MCFSSSTQNAVLLEPGWSKMDKVEAIRAIEFDQLEYIQTRVSIDFDNKKQEPSMLVFRGQSYEVEHVLFRFKTTSQEPANGYLIQVTGHRVFCVYTQLAKINRQHFVEPGFWVLSFRIKDDNELLSWYVEDRKLFGNIALKQVVNFHGHICPELAIGSKFCEGVQGLFNAGALATAGFSVVAENATSALDAIQILLGVTVGNQRLQVVDFGKHNYTLLSHSLRRGWRFTQNPLHFENQAEYEILESKIRVNDVTMEEILTFQRLLDLRVQYILSLSPEMLFTVDEIDHDHPQTESTSLYLRCAKCGEQVLASHSVRKSDRVLCLPCMQLETEGMAHTCH